MFDHFIDFVHSLYPGQDFVPLHAPVFIGNEKKYVTDCIDTTFVSSVGGYVDKFEEMIARIMGCRYAVATVNGTAALHICLKLADVTVGDEVITQPLTFVATCNAISYCGAAPIFVDVDKDTLGMSPTSLETFLQENTEVRDGKCINKVTNKVIKACVPMHTFGFACRIDAIKAICDKYHITLVEDAAEAVGSTYKNKPLGSFGDMAAVSFNGNKIVTAGGGGAIVTNDENLARLAKHITTTAKEKHAWDYNHDMQGYNYRLPNLNAALICAQLENLPFFVRNKRDLAEKYQRFFSHSDDADFIFEPSECSANYWLNTVRLENEESKLEFLKITNQNGVMTRPVWRLMNELSMYNTAQCFSIENAQQLEKILVNIPSGVRVS